MSNPPSIGRIVHVQIRSDVWRPAIVTAVWPTTINACVFLDGVNDPSETAANGATMHVYSAPHEDEAPDHDGPVWRWPPRS